MLSGSSAQLFRASVDTLTEMIHKPLTPRFASWLGRAWTGLRESVIQDVPASLEQCESCRVIDCSQVHWQSCARRLATEAERLYPSAQVGSCDGASMESLDRTTHSQEIPWCLSAMGTEDPSEDSSEHRSEDSSGQVRAVGDGTAGPRS